MDFFLLSFLVVSVQPEDKISFQELNYLLWAYAIFLWQGPRKLQKHRINITKIFYMPKCFSKGVI